MASNDQPRWTQLLKMIPFCHEHKHLFIWGIHEAQKYLEKYLVMSGITVEGYIITESYGSMLPWWWQSDASDCDEIEKNEYHISDVVKKYKYDKSLGFLIAEEDMYLNDIVKQISSEGLSFEQVYILSEYNKRAIAYKMTPRPVDRMWIEVNLADHCNLNCQMCDHFSPVAKPHFLDFDEYTRDIKRLAELTDGKMGIMKLQGGEPLLNENIIDFIKVTRETFPDCIIFLFTAGLLLKQWEKHPKGNLWQACHDYDVRIQFTIYPIGIDVQGIKVLAKKYGVMMDAFSEVGDRSFQGIKRSCKHPFRLEGDIEKWQFISCYQFNESITLKNGKLYTCPMIPYINSFNDAFGQSLSVSENDYIDIYEAKTYEELSEYMTRRTDFCRYCDVVSRRHFDWKQSKHTIDEYVDAEGEWKRFLCDNSEG